MPLSTPVRRWAGPEAARRTPDGWLSRLRADPARASHACPSPLHADRGPPHAHAPPGPSRAPFSVRVRPDSPEVSGISGNRPRFVRGCVPSGRAVRPPDQSGARAGAHSGVARGHRGRTGALRGRDARRWCEGLQRWCRPASDRRNGLRCGCHLHGLRQPRLPDSSPRLPDPQARPSGGDESGAGRDLRRASSTAGGADPLVPGGTGGGPPGAAGSGAAGVPGQAGDAAHRRPPDPVRSRDPTPPVRSPDPSRRRRTAGERAG